MFADLLYPGNPKKRKEIRDKTANARSQFVTFNREWNDFSIEFNKMVNDVINQEVLPWEGTFELKKVNIDPETQDVETMVNIINSAIENAKENIYQFNISVTASLDSSQAKEYGKLADFDKIGDIEKIFEDVIPALAGTGIAVYLGISMITTFIALKATGVALSAGVMAIGGLAAGVLSAVGFVLTDLIISSITGATERAKLDKANKQLDDMKVQIVDPLHEINGKLSGQTSAILTGSYSVSEDVLLKRKKNGDWIAIDLSEMLASNNIRNTHLQLVG
ncbi:MAG: hypothetical protein V7785_07000 [Bermanella sp.]